MEWAAVAVQCGVRARSVEPGGINGDLFLLAGCGRTFRTASRKPEENSSQGELAKGGQPTQPPYVGGVGLYVPRRHRHRWRR